MQGDCFKFLAIIGYLILIKRKAVFLAGDRKTSLMTVSKSLSKERIRVVIANSKRS